MVSLEYKTFIACTLPLAKSMAPFVLDIASDLVEIGLLPPNVAERIGWPPSDHAKSSELVSVVAAKISESRERYHEFVDILKRYPEMSDTLDLLFQTYDSEWALFRVVSIIWKPKIICVCCLATLLMN